MKGITVNNSLTVQKLYETPTLAYEITIPEPETLVLSEYSTSAYTAILANATETAIGRVTPAYRMGRVYSFDVIPVNRPDPILIFSKSGDLRPYYKLWSDVVTNGVWHDRVFNKIKLRKYDDAIRHFIQTSDLEVHEICFAIIEMLKFKNSNMFIRRDIPTNTLPIFGWAE